MEGGLNMPIVQSGFEEINDSTSMYENNLLKVFHKHRIFMQKDGYYHLNWRDIDKEVEFTLKELMCNFGYVIIGAYDNEKEYCVNKDIVNPEKFINFNWQAAISTWGYLLAKPKEGEMYKHLSEGKGKKIRDFIRCDMYKEQPSFFNSCDWQKLVKYIKNGIDYREYENTFWVQHIFDFLVYTNEISIPLYIAIETTHKEVTDQKLVVTNNKVFLVEEKL